MRTPEQIVQGVVAWALEAEPELETGYDYITGKKLGGKMPDVMVECQEDLVVKDDRRFPHSQLQQVWLNIYRLVVSVAVDNTNQQEAARQLRRIEHSLKVSLLDDGTLGGRVETISPYFNFDLSPPFVEYADGTKAREMRLLLMVGESLETTEA